MILGPSAQELLLTWLLSPACQPLSAAPPSEFWSPYNNTSFLYLIASAPSEFLMPHNLSFYIIVSPVSQVGFPGKQTLRWRSADQRFIQECSWDAHLRKGKEVDGTGWREKLNFSAVLTCITNLSQFARDFPSFSPERSMSLELSLSRRTSTIDHPSIFSFFF